MNANRSAERSSLHLWQRGRRQNRPTHPALLALGEIGPNNERGRPRRSVRFG